LCTSSIKCACYAPSDGYAYYEEWQHLVEKSDKQVKELLEAFGTKCKGHQVWNNCSWHYGRKLPSIMTGVQIYEINLGPISGKNPDFHCCHNLLAKK